MKTKSPLRILALSALLVSTLISQLSTAFAQGTTFSYQGRLDDGGTPASGSYDLRFILYTADVGGSQVGPILTNAPVGVSNGLFTTTLDFGAGVFTGPARWLEIAARTNGGGAFTLLDPRQPVTPTPYAIYAGKALLLDGALHAGQLSGTYSNALTLNNPANAFTGAFTGNGAGLSNLNAAQLNGAIPSTTLSNAWKITGNAGTTPGTHFFGTTDNQPLEVKVNNSRALRLEPFSQTPNLIVGYSGNAVAPGRGGATIAGGGTPGQANQVQHDFGTVGGGKGNDAGGQADTIGGGDRNRIGLGGFDNTIAGGLLNDVGTNTTASTIGGGWDNNIGTSLNATIAGGYQNNIANNSPSSSIGGGRDNTIAANAPHASIAGGYLNDIGLNAQVSVIGGGENNNIGADALYATIAGGTLNDILADADWSVIGGGRDNNIGSGSFYATVAGGADNNVSSNATWSAIGGGSGNTIAGTASYATIAGGNLNDIGVSASWSTIGGGQNNNIGANALFSTIAGGVFNDIFVNADWSAIGGGRDNNIGADTLYATVAGGYQNNLGPACSWSTIGGGDGNSIASNSFTATIAGGNLNAIGVDADSSAIGGGENNNIGVNSPHAVIAGGRDNTIGSGSPFATITGGRGNIIDPGNAYSFAAGRRARANHQGSFVWADSQDSDFYSASDNTFNVRAEGGVMMFVEEGSVKFNLGEGEFVLIGRSISQGLRRIDTSTGAYLSSGGNWVDASDRNLKEHFELVDPAGILQRVVSLPVTTWNYKKEPDSLRHIGPMAQDFHAAFGVGADDKHIAALDGNGVALAAIQGLNQKVEDRGQRSEVRSQRAEDRIQKLEAENAELKRELERRLEAMESLIRTHIRKN